MNTLKIIERQRDGEWVWKCADRYNQTWVHKEHGERIINTELLNYILIQILESEIERKRGMKKDTRISNGRGSTGGVACAGCSTCGGQENCCCEMYNQAIEEDITHLQGLLDSLK